jgi:uncharacterized protein
VKFSGHHDFGVPSEEVYTRLLDPDVLRTCMPGCERLEPETDDRFGLTMSVPVPALRGRYEGTMQVVDRVPSSRLRMKIKATGSHGFVEADAVMSLEDTDGGSRLSYDADAQIGGPAASVGQRMLVGISRRQIQQMMTCLDAGGAPRPGFFARLWSRIRSLFGGGSG